MPVFRRMIAYSYLPLGYLLNPVFNLKSRFWFAGVAQLVEQRIRNAKVGSSTLFTGTTQIKGLRQRRPFSFIL